MQRSKRQCGSPSTRIQISPEDYASARLLAYTCYMMPEYQISQHHITIAEKLEAVERGEIKRLMIMMPPRHGKSLEASEMFPAWYLGRNPKRQIIASTYAQDFADDIGRKVRNQLTEPSYQNVFKGVAARSDSTAAKRFHTTHGGVYYGVGIGGPITGRGADLLLIDDPIKNREDAESEVMRRRNKAWYTSTAYTRLMKGGAIIIISTRWHEDDLCGWILDQHAHENWTVLKLPAISDEGTALWPEMFPIDRLREIEKTIGPRDFSALYQQQPAPAQGALFKPEKITVISAAPAGGTIVRGWDFAATAKMGTSEPDFTVGIKLCKNKDGTLTVLDMIRFQGSPLDVEKAVLNTASQDGESVRIVMPQDPGQAGKAQAHNYTRLLSGYIIKTQPVTGSKETRAAAAAAQVEAGNISIVKGPWNEAFLHELRSFPSGKNDDIVDAFTEAFNALNKKSNDAVIDYYKNLAEKQAL